jgi:hypothetical protein
MMGAEMPDGARMAGGTPPGWRYPMRIALGVAAVFLGLFFLIGLGNHRTSVADMAGRIECGGSDGDCPGGGYAWFDFPAAGASPVEKWKVGYDTCASQSVASLARLLDYLHTDARAGTRTWATAEAVARGYARQFGVLRGIGDIEHPLGVDEVRVVYAGCLQAFTDK